jgi:hypothetical protein
MADLSKCFLHSLGERERKLLTELRKRVPEVIEKAKEQSSEVADLSKFTIFGKDIEEQSDASDIILLKYIRAEELNLDKWTNGVGAVERIVATLVFRTECQIDALTDAELPDYFLGHDTISDFDSDGRPIMISRFGQMDLAKVFGDAEAFVRYRAQLMEKAIRTLKFEPGAAEDLCQVHDYSGVPLVFHQPEVKAGVTAVSKVFGEHYPETKGKTIFVNFPSVFGKLWKAFSIVIPERTRSKFVILGQGDALSLFEHLSPEKVPEVLGGLRKEPPSRLKGPAKVVTIKARDSAEVACAKADAPSKFCWELRVAGQYEIAYEVVFVPSGDGEEDVLSRTEKGAYLRVEDGIVSGEYTAKEAGELRIRFRNEAAWFKGRVCACRAEEMNQ